MMRGTQILLLLCILGLESAAPVNAIVTKQIESISCDGDGTIHAQLMSGSWVTTVLVQCNGNPNTSPISGHSFDISGCVKGAEVNITMTNGTIDPSRYIVMKKEQIETVTCTSLTSSVTIIPVLSFGGPSIEIAHSKSLTETIKLHMSLSSDASSPVKTVVIGENYYLTITGAGNHTMYVQSCQVASNNTFVNSQPVYTNGNPTAGADNVLGSFRSTIENGVRTLNATLQGFRLIGSDTVYLKCTVKVCPSTGTCTKDARKRKGRKHQSDEHEALLRFQVRDKIFEDSANSATKSTAEENTLKILILVATAYLRYQME